MAAPSGTVWSSEVNGRGRLGIYVGKTNSSSGGSTSVSIQVWFWTNYGAYDNSNTFYFNNNATSATTSRGSVSINHTVSSGGAWNTANQTRLGTYSYNYSRTTSTQTINCAAKLTGIDWVGSTLTFSTSYTIPALTNYTVSYNANGGSGAPSSQTKWHGKTLTLSSTKPTRTGYTFQGWATSSGGSVAYAAGARYTGNTTITLYAVWKANTYTVKFDANGGSGAPSNQTKIYGQTLTLSSTKPTRANYNFKGWGTSATTTTVAYASGASYTSNAAITLYAVWELAYTPPKISVSYVKRCSYNGTDNDYGTYFTAYFSWSCDQTVGTNYVDYVKIRYKKTTETEYTDYTIISSDSSITTSGFHSPVIGNGAISVDSAYDIEIIVADRKGGVTNISRTIGGAAFLIDFLSDGKGIAFGKPASRQNAADCAYDFYANKELYDKYGKKITNGLAVYQDAAAGYIDPNTTLDHIILTAHANAPMGAGTLYYIYTVFYQNKYSSSYRAQWAIPYNENGSMYHRYYSGSWSAWRRHVNEDEMIVKRGRSSVSFTSTGTKSATISTGLTTIESYAVTVSTSVPQYRWGTATYTGTNLNVYVYSNTGSGTVGFAWIAIGK